MVALPCVLISDTTADGFRLIPNYDDSPTDAATDFRRAVWMNGFRPVPVRTGEKRPAGTDWPKVALGYLPPCLKVGAHARSDALNTGILCDGFRVIDIDVDDAVIVGQIEALARDLLGDALVRFRANSPRVALVYRAADGAPPKRALSGEHGQIEVLGSGQQFVAHGVHPSGAEYQWRAGSPATVPREEIPAVTEENVGDFLTDAARLIGAPEAGKRQHEETPPAQPGPSLPGIITMPALHDHPLVRARVDAAFNNEVAGVATHPGNGRNEQLNKAAFALSQFVAAGLLAEGQVRAALEQAAVACGLWKDDGPSQCRKTINSGFTSGMKEPRPIPASILAKIEEERQGAEIATVLLRQADGNLLDEATGEIIDAPDPTAIVAGRAFPDHLTYVPGFVGEALEWILAGARRPSRAMALGAALAIVGTAMGRYWCGPTMSGTHLYTLSLAPTGAGKDHPIQQIRRAFTAASMTFCLGTEEFQSSPSVINMVLNKPVSICTMDEFGAFIARINSRRAGGFEMGITKSLRTLWGTNYGIFLTPEWAARPSEVIHAPSMGIYAASTHDDFFAAVDSKQAVNGFLNRFLLLSVETRPTEVEPELPADLVPDYIVSGLHRRWAGGNWQHGLEACSQGSVQITPHVIPWHDDAARGVYKALVREIEKIGDRYPDAVPYLARTAEIAVRLATIRACGINHLKPTVTVADIEWGRAVAMHSAESMAIMAGKYVADTDAQADAKRIIRIIEEAGGQIRKRELLRKLAHRMKNRDLKDVLDALKDSGTITIAKEKGATVPEYDVIALRAD